MRHSTRGSDLVSRSWTISFTASVLLLAGCSGGSANGGATGGEPSVASVTDAKPSSGAASAQDERPLIRADTSPEEEQRFMDLYLKCLEQKGVPKKTDSGLKLTAAQQAKADSGYAACASKQPEDYTFRLKRTDPAAYADSRQKEARCLKSHGIAIEVDADGEWGFTNPRRDMALPIVDECQRNSFPQP
jgi:hypothetical protein